MQLKVKMALATEVVEAHRVYSFSVQENFSLVYKYVVPESSGIMKYLQIFVTSKIPVWFQEFKMNVLSLAEIIGHRHFEGKYLCFKMVACPFQ